MATEAFVQVAPDSTGAKIRNLLFDFGGGDDRLVQVIALADPDVQARLLALLITQPALAAVGVPTRPIPFRPANASTSAVSAAVTDTELLAANVNRIGAVIYNDSTADLKVKLGTAASATDFSDVIAAKGPGWRVPFGYTGAIHGLWAVANGAARITEVTP